MNTKTKIIENVIKEAQEETIMKISTINVAKRSQTSESNVYKIFRTKNNLLIETFLYIDEKIGNYIQDNSSKLLTTSIEEIIGFSKNVWMSYLDFFVKHYEYAIYYSAFRMCKLYTTEISKKQNDHYIHLSSMFEYISKSSNFYDFISFNLFWSFILDTTLLIAKRMATGEIEYNENNIENAYHLVFDGLINVLLANINAN